MNRNNLKIILSTIGIAIVVALMGTATYAYFTLEIEGVGKNNTLNTFNKNMEITYTETSNVTLENAYTGDSVTKTFTVKNTGNTDVYYNVVLENVVNNFAKPEELTYIISEANNVAYGSSGVPTADDTILADIKIKTGETHTYTLKIIFRELETDQSYNMGKTFSGMINVVPSENSSLLMNLKSNTLLYKIINNESTLYQGSSSGDSALGYNFSDSNSKIIRTGLSTDTTTFYILNYTNQTPDKSRSYIYIGDNTINNNVLFGGYCWKIIRTTDNYAIRMIYNGVPTNGACTNATGDDATIGNSVFNTNASYNAYVGYMYGTPNSTSYDEEHKNINNSAIKTMLENWYANNLLQYNDYIEDTTFCNSKMIIDDSLFGNENIYGKIYTLDGFGNSATSYTYTGDYSCPLPNDNFSVKNGNNKYPIGLLEYIEAAMAGINSMISDGGGSILQGSFFDKLSDLKVKKLSSNEIITQITPSYLSNSGEYWTMTPYDFYDNVANVIAINGTVYEKKSVNTSLGVRPVIALKSNVVVLSGDGSLSSPYKITE